MNKKTLLTILLLIILIWGVYWIMSDKSESNIDIDNTDTEMDETLDNTSDEDSDTVIPMETDQGPVTSGENPQPGSQVHDLPVEPAAAVARKDLADNLSINEKSIVIIKITEETWNDGCLGLGGPTESCLMALVPGFRVEMLAQGKTYFYRTDTTGASFRLETSE